MANYYTMRAKHGGTCSCGKEIRKGDLCLMSPDSLNGWYMLCSACTGYDVARKAYTAKCRVVPPKVDLTEAFRRFPLPWSEK